MKFKTTKFSDLDEIQKTDLKFLIEKYKLILRIAIKIFEALKVLNTHVISFVDRNFLMYLIENVIVYQKLNCLKTRLAPTNRAKKIEMIKKYRKLQKSPKSQQLNQ